MITQKAKDWKSLHDAMVAHGSLRKAERYANKMFDELLNNCKPTKREWEKLWRFTHFTPYIFYKLFKGLARK